MVTLCNTAKNHIFSSAEMHEIDAPLLGTTYQPPMRHTSTRHRNIVLSHTNGKHCLNTDVWSVLDFKEYLSVVSWCIHLS